MQNIRSRDKRLARHVAREAWIDTDGNIERSEILFRDNEHITKLDPMTIIALIQIAIEIWKWWQSRKIAQPSVIASSDEPYATIDDGDDPAEV